MRKKKERNCPCGSGLRFSECCQNVLDGETPADVRRVIENCVVKTVDLARESRGELCLYVAQLVKDLLNEYGIKSYIVAGSASWNEYPHHYQWKPPKEFHVWVRTQYNEVVDLACDAFHTRSDAHSSIGPLLGISSPNRCWIKEPNDRVYTPVDLGARSLPFDRRGYENLKVIALDIFLKKP